MSLSSNEPTQPESKTSADELALDINILASSNHRTTAVGAQKNSQPRTSSNRYVKKNESSQINKRSGTGSGRPVSDSEILSRLLILSDKWSLRRVLLYKCRFSGRSLKCFHAQFKILCSTDNK